MPRRQLTHRAAFVRGLSAGGLIALAWQALDFLMHPREHPNTGTVRLALVVIQAVACVMGAIWMTRGIPGEPDPATLAGAPPQDQLGAAPQEAPAAGHEDRSAVRSAPRP
jgi:hypothetical protein